MIELKLDQTSLQVLHTQLSYPAPLFTLDSIKEPSEGHLDQSETTLRRAESSHQAEPNEDTRASKRLCLPGLLLEPSNNDVFKVLVGKVSTIIQSNCGETMANLRTSIQ
jgi:serine/threonine-protein kinase ATR